MKITAGLFISIILFTLISCIGGYKYEEGQLPTTPINLSDFNTEYDDYNSTAPTLGDLIPFCFSTNRNSFGNEFDIIYEPMNVNFDRSSGILKVTNEYANWLSISGYYTIIQKGLDKIATEGNEFGPNLIIDPSITENYYTLLYSTDVEGDSQIKFVSNLTDSLFSIPNDVHFLNSEFEDLYPTLNSDRSKIYFCSDRNGQSFDFYSVNIDTELDIETVLSDTADYEIQRSNILSSEFDDKCPFIYQNKIVFASNREGGFGGYDLYYSNYEDGEWSEPLNFGASINSAADEFRPILINEGVTNSQTMMVFSSNRLGGQGGFDLYFVGIEIL